MLKESDLAELVTEDHISLIVREQMRINSLLEIKLRLETDLAKTQQLLKELTGEQKESLRRIKELEYETQT